MWGRENPESRMVELLLPGVRAGPKTPESLRAIKEAMRLLACAGLLTFGVILSCGGRSNYDVCNCVPTEPASKDYRHDAKHVPLPTGTPQEIAVTTILSWPQGPAPAANAPRTGRELQLFHIGRAYLQSVSVNTGDCDFHIEVSQTPDKTAPRVIVETPGDSEYCPARQNLQQELSKRGIQLPDGAEVTPPAPISILGLAFQDFEHNRGTRFVATVWELHPAIVTILP